MNAIDTLVYDLQRSVTMAHECLAQKINAVPHVALLNIDWKIVIAQFLSQKSCAVICPVSATKPILSLVRIYLSLESGMKIPDSEADERRKMSTALAQ